MIPSIQKNVFVHLSDTAIKLDNDMYHTKEKITKTNHNHTVMHNVNPIHLNNVSLKNRLRVNALRKRKEKLNKLDEIEESITKVKRMVEFLSKNKKIDSKQSNEYSKVINYLLQETEKKKRSI
jgi:hypothetical protein